MAAVRILVVEDESVVAMDLRDSLENMGYTVIAQASRGEAAIQTAEALQPDLVLMDIRLRGDMDGIEAAEQIRTRFNIPVIFLTAHADADTLQRAQVTEPYGYILKPFEERELASNIAIALYKHTSEQKLRQSEQKYRNLFETMAQGVVYQDADGKITSANPATERILGLSLDQMQGRTSVDPLWRAIHPDGSDFPGDTYPAAVALQTGREVRNVIMGVYHPQQEDYVWITIYARPEFRTAESKPYQVVVTFEDITTIHRTEQALRASDTKFHGVVENSTDAIVLVDEYGVIIEWNRAAEQIFGLPREKTIEQYIWDIQYYLNPPENQTPERYKHIKEIYSSILASKEMPAEFETHEVDIERPDGVLRTIQDRTFIVDAGGGFLLASIIRDITARKQIELAEREQRQLAEALRDSAEALSSSLKFDDVLERILDYVGQVVPYDAVAIVLIEDGKLHIARHRGWTERGYADFISRMDLTLDDFPGLQHMFKSQELFVVADVSTEKTLSDFPATHWVQSYAGVPICIRDQVIGFLNLCSARSNFYSQTHIDRLKAFASQAGMAIDNARLFEQTHYYSITDGLTGLYNSRYFFILAKLEFERVRRYNGVLSVLMLDADYFKSVNDTYGHQVGDEVLRHIGQLIHGSLRKVDVAARYGGEEFIILMPETGLNEAYQAAERIRQVIYETPIIVEGHTISVSVSIGAAGIGSGDLDFNILVKHADDALYQAKAAGRNQVSLWQDGGK